MFDYLFNLCYTLGMKNSLTTSDIRDLTNEGTEFGVDNRAINELLNEAQEREEFEAWLDSRMDDARAHMDAKWAEQEEPDLASMRSPRVTKKNLKKSSCF